MVSALGCAGTQAASDGAAGPSVAIHRDALAAEPSSPAASASCRPASAMAAVLRMNRGPASWSRLPSRAICRGLIGG